MSECPALVFISYIAKFRKHARCRIGDILAALYNMPHVVPQHTLVTPLGRNKIIMGHVFGF